ncbi:hypothetical protein L7F22_035986 [Adiantum nelumboides]|nr:hypothetical protein [Adiantum nelumboides]
MKKGTAMSNHLNEFNTIFSSLNAQEVEFEDSVKAVFLLITLLESGDIFCTWINNSAPASGHTSTNVESNLLTREVNKKNLDNTRSSNALLVKGRSNEKGKSKDKRSKSKSHGCSLKDMECYHCGKKGHVKKDCQREKRRSRKEIRKQSQV